MTIICPRCGLRIELRARWLTITHCPRCTARSRTIVELFSSRVPAEVLCAGDSLPRAHADSHTGRDGESTGTMVQAR